MKKELIILVSICLPMFWQCESGPSRAELNKVNDSLLIENAQKDVQLNRLVESFGTIEENLRIIKEKENIISLRSSQSELEFDTREQINDDIMLIYDLMLENKNRIQELEKQLKNAGVEGSRLNKLVSGLTAQLEERSREIAILNEKLHSKDVEIEDLSKSVSELTTSLESMRTISRQTQTELTETQELLHVAHYAMGTKKELKDRKIIVGGDKKLMTKDFDRQYFNTVDYREVVSIMITGKNAKVLTIHPNGSYKLEKVNNGSFELKILDKEDFWSITKYLVIQIN